MSETVPRFERGERVRIMATASVPTAMRNKRGTVERTTFVGGMQQCLVDVGERGVPEWWNAPCLAHVP